MFKILLFFILSSFLFNVFSQEEFKSPFDEVVPKESVSKKESSEDVILPPNLSVEGILWGTDTPCAIIEGKVYKVGDSLDSETKLINIEKNIVFIQHKGKVFKFYVSKRREK